MSGIMYKNFEDYVNKRKDIFDKHIAKLTKIPSGENDCIVEFKNPATSDGAMVFIYCKGYLTIQGDYGNGSFTWHNPKNTLAWIADTDFCYFMSKLCSGEAGEAMGLMKDFDSDLCIEQVEAYIEEYEIEVGEYEACEHTGWKAHTGCQTEWLAYLISNGEKAFGDDYWESLPSFGEHIKVIAYIWKYGLMKAVEFLETEK